MSGEKAPTSPSASGGGNPIACITKKCPKKGKVAHTTPKKADKLIRKHLSNDAKKSIKNNKKILGKAQIVGEPEWSKAGIAHYGENRWKTKKIDRLNGFVDKNGNVWVHKDRGNPATMIHEGVHKYSSKNMIKESQPLNEGVTEYYTRKISDAENIAPARRNYQKNYETTKALSNLVSEDKLSKAYFDGDINQLSKTVDKKQGKGTWDKFTELTKKKKWIEAKELLKPKE
jgi:hypothetical protein